jgi:hypothetical protein
VSVYCTTSFSACSRRRTKMPIIYPDLRLDYKVATHPNDRLALAGEFPIDLSGGVETWFKSHGKKKMRGQHSFQRLRATFSRLMARKIALNHGNLLWESLSFPTVKGNATLTLQQLAACVAILENKSVNVGTAPAPSFNAGNRDRWF